MELGKTGEALIKSYEGLYLESYLCPAGVPTLGWGTTVYPDGTKVQLGESCTKEEAQEFFDYDMKNKYGPAVKKSVVYPLLKEQEQFDALVSFVYNVGGGGLLPPNSIDRRIRAGEPLNKVISEELPRWNKGPDGELAGLTRRRKEEVELFLSASTPVEKLFIELGDTSDNVLALQKAMNQWLRRWNKPIISEDSDFGPKSLAAVNDFCRNNRLEQNPKGVSEVVFNKIVKLYGTPTPINDTIKAYARGSSNQLSENFHLSEFTCKCGRCKSQLVGTKLVRLLQELRVRMGVPLSITSAYRCPTHNRNVGGASQSRHVEGDAVDISIANLDWQKLVRVAKEVGFTGIGYGQDRGFIHLDTWLEREWDY